MSRMPNTIVVEAMAVIVVPRGRSRTTLRETAPSASHARWSCSSARYGAGPRRRICPRASVRTPWLRNALDRSVAWADRIARKPPRRSSGIGSMRAACSSRSSASIPDLSSADLMPVDRPEPLRRQTLLGVELEDGRRSIVRGGVVGRAGKRQCAGAVRHAGATPRCSSAANSANQPVKTGRMRQSGGTRRKAFPSPS